VIPESGYVNAVALGLETTLAKEIWALVDTRLQKWNMVVEGWEDVVVDEDVANIVRPAIRNAFPSAPSDDSALDLELIDLALER
jgi:nuclear pore complex protein Nup133